MKFWECAYVCVCEEGGREGWREGEGDAQSLPWLQSLLYSDLFTQLFDKSTAVVQIIIFIKVRKIFSFHGSNKQSNQNFDI